MGHLVVNSIRQRQVTVLRRLNKRVRAFEPDFVDQRQGNCTGKKMPVIASEDFEDIELAVAGIEYIYGGAEYDQLHIWRNGSGNNVYHHSPEPAHRRQYPQIPAVRKLIPLQTGCCRFASSKFAG